MATPIPPPVAATGQNNHGYSEFSFEIDASGRIQIDNRVSCPISNQTHHEFSYKKGFLTGTLLNYRSGDALPTTKAPTSVAHLDGVSMVSGARQLGTENEVNGRGSSGLRSERTLQVGYNHPIEAILECVRDFFRQEYRTAEINPNGSL